MCEDKSIDWVELGQTMFDVSAHIEKLNRLEGIQALAIAFKIKANMDIIYDKLSEVTTIKIVCHIMDKFKLTEYAEEVDDKLEELDEFIEDLDKMLSSVPPNMTFDDIKNTVTPLVDNFEDEKNDLDREIKDILKTLFRPLTEIGASQSSIELSIEELALNEKPKDLIITLFESILEKEIAKVK